MILTHKQEVLEHIGETSSSIYDKAYQQGRADKYHEITSEYMLMTEELLKHNINDAIDDFAKTLISKVEECENSIGGVGVNYTVFEDMIKEIWQQLKEQKNE